MTDIKVKLYPNTVPRTYLFIVNTDTPKGDLITWYLDNNGDSVTYLTKICTEVLLLFLFEYHW